MQHQFRKFLIRSYMGFITDNKQVEELIREDRLQPILVRCGSGRFTCPAQDVLHFVEIINNNKSDYVRDLSVFTVE